MKRGIEDLLEAAENDFSSMSNEVQRSYSLGFVQVEIYTPLAQVSSPLLLNGYKNPCRSFL